MGFTYKDDLASPIEPPVQGLLASEEDKAADRRMIGEERARKMDMLFGAHGIERGQWAQLCYALAFTHVPGFKLAKGRKGRPRKWSNYDRAALVVAVEETGLPIKEAAEQLARLAPWKSKVKATRGAATLRDEFTRADKRWVAMLRELRDSARLALDMPDLPAGEKERARQILNRY